MLMLDGSVFSGGVAKRSVDTEDIASRTHHMGHQMNPGLEGRLLVCISRGQTVPGAGLESWAQTWASGWCAWLEGHAVLNEPAHLRGGAHGCPRILKHPRLENQAGPGLRREASPNCKARIVPG